MRVVTLEEHFTRPDLYAAIDSGIREPREWFTKLFDQVARTNRAHEIGEKRLGDMDAAGITVQVLSLSPPGADVLGGNAGVEFARAANDGLAEACAKHPDRFAGFAHLPMTAPEQAAEELTRCVRNFGFKGALINGMTQDRFLDDPTFEPIFAAAEALDVPLYLHPNLPPDRVRETYYGHLPGPAAALLATAAWGWHSETALHVLRLAITGVFDRHPKLKLIIGHMGEGLPFMLDRASESLAPVARHTLTRSVKETLLDQVWITTSGLFTLPPFLCALVTFGADRILFSVDYPLADEKRGRAFLDQLPISTEDRAKIAHRTADKLLKL